QRRPLALAAAGRRQLGRELDDAGELVGGGLRFAVLLKLADQALVAAAPVAEDDDRADDRAALGVGGGDRGGVGHGGMGEEGGLDLGRPDPVSGGEDDVVAAPLEEEVAVLVF